LALAAIKSRMSDAGRAARVDLAALYRLVEQHDKGRGVANWPAWIRRMDRLDPSFRD
jgi:hypothetical protein